MPTHHRRHPRSRHHDTMSRGGHHRGRGRGRGRRGRVHRGEVRAAILRLLTEEPMHGYQIMQEMQERSDGAWRPSPGSIYPTLQQLADEGLVESSQEGGKNIFHLTTAGRETADALEGPPAWERLSDDQPSGARALRGAMIKLGAAVKLVAETGDSRLIESANEILRDTRRKVYDLLATD